MGSLAGRLFVCRILARQHLERSIQLWVSPVCVAEIERHLDVRSNAAAFQALAVDPALGSAGEHKNGAVPLATWAHRISHRAPRSHQVRPCRRNLQRLHSRLGQRPLFQPSLHTSNMVHNCCAAADCPRA